MARWAVSIVWTSFLMAGVLEILLFALVDPGDLRWFGGASLNLSNLTVYSLAFLIFWFIIGLAGLLTALLVMTPDAVPRATDRNVSG
jgi:hypothetical protein